MTVEAILFDFDGVLIDTPCLHNQALNIALKEHGFCPVYNYGAGETSKAKLKRMLPDHEDAHRSILRRKGEIFDELFRDAIKYCKKNPIKDFLGSCLVGIASNSKYSYILRYLHAMKINPDDLAVIISQDDVEKGKPDSEIYDLAVIELAMKPDRVLAVEDSDEGIESARGAGCRVYRTDYTKLKVDEIKAYMEAL